MATYPTPAQIDAAVPIDGTPSRALTNAVLKAVSEPPTFAQVTGVPAPLTTPQAAGTPSIRAIGTTATTAAAGNHTHGAATGSAAGFMAAADKTKLDGLLPFKLAAARPETPTSPGTQWEVFIDGEEFFLCIAPNVWRMWTLMSWGE